MDHEFKQAQVGDTSLAYVERGQGSPVVFVHGGGPTDLRSWEPQFEPFAEHYRVIAYSQRNHHPNPWLGDISDMYSTSLDAKDLATLITGLRLGRVHLIGNSYGADIILRLAVEYPELVRTLVVEEPGLDMWLADLPGGPAMIAESANTFTLAKTAVLDGDHDRGIRLFLKAVLGSDLFDQLPSSVQQRLRDNARLIGTLPTDPSEFITSITREDASTIQAPTLIVTGDESPEMFLLVSEELARLLPNGEEAQIEGASHLLHAMNPQAFNATVMEFLHRHAG